MDIIKLFGPGILLEEKEKIEMIPNELIRNAIQTSIEKYNTDSSVLFDKESEFYVDLNNPLLRYFLKNFTHNRLVKTKWSDLYWDYFNGRFPDLERIGGFHPCHYGFVNFQRECLFGSDEKCKKCHTLCIAKLKPLFDKVK